MVQLIKLNKVWGIELCKLITVDLANKWMNTPIIGNKPRYPVGNW
jgi:hypothetical protein